MVFSKDCLVMRVLHPSSLQIQLSEYVSPFSLWSPSMVFPLSLINDTILWLLLFWFSKIGKRRETLTKIATTNRFCNETATFEDHLVPDWEWERKMNCFLTLNMWRSRDNLSSFHTLSRLNINCRVMQVMIIRWKKRRRSERVVYPFPKGAITHYQ